MYIETIPRQLGGLASHLLHTGRGSNERVVVRSDLSRDIPHDVELALRLLAAPARRISRMKRDVVHVVISPERALTRAELEWMLTLFEAEYCIPADNGRLVVEHQKGKRASHFHIAYSAAAENSGKALRFSRSRDRDEMLARRLEITFGMKLQPSTRVDRTADLLRKRGLDDLAEIAAAGPRAEPGRNRSKAERQQEKRLDVDRQLIDVRLMQAWRQCAGDLHRLPSELRQLGFALAAGTKLVAGVPIVRMVDVETLYSGSLTHELNRARKAAGETERVREPAMGAACGELRPENEVKAGLRNTASQRASAALLGEFDHLVAEMNADGERLEAAKARKGRARLAARLSAEEKEDLRLRQDRVKERYRQRNRIRRARVNRAFLAARLFADRDIRNAALYLSAVGVIMTGAGLIPALAAASFVVGALPSFASAKRLRSAADREANLERLEMAREVQDAVRSFFRERAVRQIAMSKKAHAERMRLQMYRARQRSAFGPEAPPPSSRRTVQRSPSRRPGGLER